MRDHSHHIELSRDDAVAQMLARCPFSAADAMPEEGKAGRMAKPKRPIEQIALSDAYGRGGAPPQRGAPRQNNKRKTSQGSGRRPS